MPYVTCISWSSDGKTPGGGNCALSGGFVSFDFCLACPQKTPRHGRPEITAPAGDSAPAVVQVTVKTRQARFTAEQIAAAYARAFRCGCCPFSRGVYPEQFTRAGYQLPPRVGCNACGCGSIELTRKDACVKGYL